MKPVTAIVLHIATFTLKSDLGGIETIKNNLEKEGVIKLKSDLGGIETSLYIDISHTSIIVKIRPWRD